MTVKIRNKILQANLIHNISLQSGISRTRLRLSICVPHALIITAAEKGCYHLLSCAQLALGPACSIGPVQFRVALTIDPVMEFEGLSSPLKFRFSEKATKT